MDRIELAHKAWSAENIWRKFLPPHSELFYSEYSGLYFVKEINNGSDRYFTLDRIAQVAKNKKGIVSAYGRHMRISKREAAQLANDLQEQAERLNELANSYRLLSLAISVSINDIEDIIVNDPLLKKEMDNPF